ncbi:MAG: prepilin-type N-terminal cleavage/methylation domain-containing protein [Gemmatimonadaceae bacterium]
MDPGRVVPLEYKNRQRRLSADSYRSTTLTRGSTGARGFSLLEVVISVVIVVVLSATVFPVVAEQVERRRVDAAISTLKDLADAATAFRKDVGMNPGWLVDLSNPITTSGTNSCGAVYTTAAVNAWAGPYYKAQILIAAGLPLSEENLGRVQNTLVRNPSGLAPGSLAFQVTDAPPDRVSEIDAVVDGDGNAATGRVQWTSPSGPNGYVTLSYLVAINGC